MIKLVDLERNVRIDIFKSLSFTNIFDFIFCSFSSIEAYAKYASESLEFKVDLFRINAYNWVVRTEKSLGPRLPPLRHCQSSVHFSEAVTVE